MYKSWKRKLLTCTLAYYITLQLLEENLYRVKLTNKNDENLYEADLIILNYSGKNYTRMRCNDLSEANPTNAALPQEQTPKTNIPKQMLVFWIQVYLIVQLIFTLSYIKYFPIKAKIDQSFCTGALAILGHLKMYLGVLRVAIWKISKSSWLN